MDLADRCSREFDRRDWRRGKEYFRAGAVSIQDQTVTSLIASVQGSRRQPYSTQLDWSEAGRDVLLVDCSCPRFEEMGLCKHVAATILAADARNIGWLVPGTEDFSIETLKADPEGFVGRDRDPFEDDDADADDADADDERDEFHGPGGIASVRPKKIGTVLPSVSEAKGRAPRKRLAKPPRMPDWKQDLALLNSLQTTDRADHSAVRGRPLSPSRQIWYLLDVQRTLSRGWPIVTLRQRTIKKDGTPGKPKAARLSRGEANLLPSTEDRTLLGLLVGNERDVGYGYGYSDYGSYVKLSDFAIAPAMFDVLLPRLCATGRFGWLPAHGSKDGDQIRPLAWDDGPPWRLKLVASKTSDGKFWQLRGVLERGTAVEELTSPLVLMAAGLVVFPDRIARLEAGDEFRWTMMLRQQGPLLVPIKQEQELVEQLALSPSLPSADWPSELRWEEESVAPIPQLLIAKSKRSWQKDLECCLTFRYGERSATFGGGAAGWYDRQTRRVVRRDLAAERGAAARLGVAGVQRHDYYGDHEASLFFLPPKKMPALVLQLTSEGWHVEAEGQVVRRAGQMKVSVTSGVDWFDLEATCEFDGVSASLPSLLAALHRGQQFVELDDGSRGMLPGEWLARYAPLAALGRAEGDRLRFLPTQAVLLDALLAAQETEQVTVDKSFARLREQLRSFDGIPPRTESSSFVGELRQYQREGLGWLHFLDEFGFGGCLADDMGLGKTVQVLALLDAHREQRDLSPRKPRSRAKVLRAPSLIVVPRSLVFNWLEEARRFTPQLRVLDYTGLDRGAVADRLHEFDLVVTTYGTLRRDIARLREVEFDYAILDEAQAIKNAASHAAKACRLLRARRRLAMTGTPVENHLGELWSLFEFLNPGMLGRNQKLHQIFGAGRQGRRVNGAPGDGNSSAPADEVALLARALRPFLLRRTKQQVLSELPAKTEQTLYCELDGAERKRYEELREHYRRTLLERVDKVGLQKSKIHVLEALLRLRQAACHRGLLDKKHIDESSAKLETLLEQLDEVIDGGHKALVFSQFTSLLAIVRRQLDRRQIVYEYLDGRTVKRQARVERFQTDPDCRLFLISLKAGGQGLNLTAADYVFILDPWWNPAVEAQAVDRAHRIGQDRHVFAYRLIARDTVEEKILQLQDHKRDLANAIISADNGLVRNLTAEDLQLLLS